MRMTIDPGDAVWLLAGRVARRVLSAFRRERIQVSVILEGETATSFSFKIILGQTVIVASISQQAIEDLSLDLGHGSMGGLGDEPGVREGVADWMVHELVSQVVGDLGIALYFEREKWKGWGI